MYLLQVWFNLSDPGTEDAIYDSYAMRKFTGIDFLSDSVPDETTLCNFRHLLEEHGPSKLFFDAINRVMEETGHIMKGGTIVNATIIDAPSSTKNAEKKRDPEMHSTKKGNQWRFGMKCHVNLRPGRFPKVSDDAIDWTRWIEKRKSSDRCKVEHIFHVIKCQFEYRKPDTGA